MGLGVILVILGAPALIAGLWLMITARYNGGQVIAGGVIASLGMVILSVATWALKLALLRPVSSYVAGEASPAIEIASTAVAHGLEQTNLFRGPPSPETIVKVKCKACGYLDSEDATYCSKCGKPL